MLLLQKRIIKKKWIAVFLVLALLLGAAGCGTSKAVAEVNGEKITRGQLDVQMNILRVLMPQMEPMFEDKERRASLEVSILDGIVDSVLIKQAVSDQGIAISDEERAEFLQQYRMQLNMIVGSEEELQKQLKKYKVSEEDLNQFLSVQLYSEKLWYSFLDSLTDDDVRGFLEKNPEYALTPVMLELSHILFESEEEALAARERLLTGEDFGDLAEELSIDQTAQEVDDQGYRGYLGNIPANTEQLYAEFMVGANELAEEGEISQPVESRVGWHLIKLHKRTEAAEINFEEIRDMAAEAAAEEKFEIFFIGFKEGADVKTFL